MKRRGEALKAAKQASARAAAIVHDEMNHGVSSLAFTRSAAPWLGVLGALRCVYDSFGGMHAEGISQLRVVCGGVSEGLVIVAFGLLVSLIATWLRAYLLKEVEGLDNDMKTASLQLLNDLSSATF
jgi:biopolymer transport protein ExbB/TolQ